MYATPLSKQRRRASSRIRGRAKRRAIGEMEAARYNTQRWGLDDPFSHLCAFQKAGDELILLIFSGMAATLACGRHQVVISYLSCIYGGRLVQGHGGRGCMNGGGVCGRCGVTEAQAAASHGEGEDGRGCTVRRCC
jgi:hypothetical protein